MKMRRDFFAFSQSFRCRFDRGWRNSRSSKWRICFQRCKLKCSRSKLRERLKESTSVLDHVLKINLVKPSVDYSQLHYLAEENRIIAKAIADLSIIIYDLGVKSSDSSWQFRVADTAQAMALTNLVIKKQNFSH